MTQEGLLSGKIGKGADCQVFFNDPEEVDAEPEDLFEADYVRVIDESGTRSREVIVVGPSCLSTIPHADSSDSDSQSEEDSDKNDDQQELADGLWLMDTGSGHDLTIPSGAENCDMQKVRKIVFTLQTAGFLLSAQFTSLAIYYEALQHPSCYQIRRGCSLKAKELCRWDIVSFGLQRPLRG